MKVLMMSGDPAGQVTGCGLYRLHLPAQQLNREDDWHVDVAASIPARKRNLPDGRVECWECPPLDYDIVVFQRPAGFTLASVIPHVAKWATVIVELDDDLERTSVDNDAYNALHPSRSLHENWTYLKDACRIADMVTVTTPALTRYARTGRAAVLPNYVPQVLIRVERKYEWIDRKPRLGWSGKVGTHPNDLQTTRGGVARALSATGCSMHIVGEPAGVREALGIAESTEVTATGWVPINGYPDELTAIDVGIVPLEDSTFNHAKSYLKGLEFAALGIPFVASPTPAYRQLHDEHGIGLLARRPRDWERLTTQLLTDEKYRRELGESWRAKVADNLTCETNGWRWMRAYEKAARYGTARREALTTAGR